jgi:membrane protease YdiL (CAAX protease family)
VTNAPDATFASAIVSSIGIFLLISFQEELLFRGYIFTNLAEGLNTPRVGPRWAMISATLLSASIFSLLHLKNAHASVNSTISAFLGGIILTLGFLLTGELAISIGFHCTWNAFQNAVFGFPVSGEAIAPASFIKVKQTGPVAWVGDSFGPESGLLVIGAVAFGCTLIILWARLRYGRVGLQSVIMRPVESQDQ